MKVSTWNVNTVRNRLPLLLAWLDVTKPDIVALQELKATNDEFPRAELAAAGYGALVVGQKSWNGVALLAREAEPIEIRRSLPGDSKDTQARYVEAAISGLVVASLYLPNGNPYPGPKFDYKMAWFQRLLEHSKELWNSGHPVLLMGDFNVVPTEADMYVSTSYADNALVQREPREAYQALLKQGWTDALRKKHPRESMYTFWDYRRNRWQRDAGLRIDHILLSKALRSRLLNAGVDQAVRGMENPSDHAPAWVELSNS